MMCYSSGVGPRFSTWSPRTMQPRSPRHRCSRLTRHHHDYPGPSLSALAMIETTMRTTRDPQPTPISPMPKDRSISYPRVGSAAGRDGPGPRLAHRTSSARTGDTKVKLAAATATWIADGPLSSGNQSNQSCGSHGGVVLLFLVCSFRSWSFRNTTSRLDALTVDQPTTDLTRPSWGSVSNTLAPAPPRHSCGLALVLALGSWCTWLGRARPSLAPPRLLDAVLDSIDRRGSRAHFELLHAHLVVTSRLANRIGAAASLPSPLQFHASPIPPRFVAFAATTVAASKASANVRCAGLAEAEKVRLSRAVCTVTPVTPFCSTTASGRRRGEPLSLYSGRHHG